MATKKTEKKAETAGKEKKEAAKSTSKGKKC